MDHNKHEASYELRNLPPMLVFSVDVCYIYTVVTKTLVAATVEWWMMLHKIKSNLGRNKITKKGEDQKTHRKILLHKSWSTMLVASSFHREMRSIESRKVKASKHKDATWLHGHIPYMDSLGYIPYRHILHYYNGQITFQFPTEKK